MSLSGWLLGRLRLKDAAAIEDINQDAAIDAHRRIIRAKPFLQSVYRDVYRTFARTAAAAPPGLRVEIGSGAGFIKEAAPEVLTSDICAGEGVDRVFSAEKMPFEDRTAGAIFMFNTLHHIKNVERFFSEARRCLKDGGRVVMIEPANTCWSRFVYKRLGHEPFDPDTLSWEVAGEGRLSDSNQALPWIVFRRDRARFEKLFPELKVRRFEPRMPLCYILSGGLSLRQLVPGWTYPVFRGLEMLLTPLNRWIGLFVLIELERIPGKARERASEAG